MFELMFTSQLTVLQSKRIKCSAKEYNSTDSGNQTLNLLNLFLALYRLCVKGSDGITHSVNPVQTVPKGAV